MGTSGSLKGKLLVAAPMLADPNFHRTVVLILEHDGGGAAGVVLNRPSTSSIGDSLPEWEAVAASPAVVFVGGPVSPTSAIGLGRHPAGADVGAGFAAVFGTIGTVDLALRPDDLAVQVAEVRIFAGYAGWGPGQLEGELAVDAWWVAAARSEDAFAADAHLLWSNTIRRLRGTRALFATYPLDADLN